LAAALAVAPLAADTGASGLTVPLAQQKSEPPSATKPSALTRPVEKAKEARQAAEKASAKSNAVTPAAGQAPAQAPPAAAPKQAPPAAAPRVTRSGDRRDPFRTMIREKQGDQPIQVECGTLTRSILIGQTELSGIVKEPGGYIAVVSVRGGERTYFLRENTPVCNGVVQNITPDSIVFRENVIDPMGRPVQREVTRKIPAEAK